MPQSSCHNDGRAGWTVRSARLVTAAARNVASVLKTLPVLSRQTLALPAAKLTLLPGATSRPPPLRLRGRHGAIRCRLGDGVRAMAPGRCSAQFGSSTAARCRASRTTWVNALKLSAIMPMTPSLGDTLTLLCEARGSRNCCRATSAWRRPARWSGAQEVRPRYTRLAGTQAANATQAANDVRGLTLLHHR